VHQDPDPHPESRERQQVRGDLEEEQAERGARNGNRRACHHERNRAPVAEEKYEHHRDREKRDRPADDEIV
jgi:hypothetical protein